MASTATTSRPFTRADLQQFPDDGNRYELLDGAVLMTPSPISRHQHVVMQVATLVRDAGTYVLTAPLDIVFDEETVLQPDVCVWGERFDLDGPTPPPDLVVEVSSPYTWRRDLSLKRDRYATEGITEYWFLDLHERRILVHHLTEDGDGYDVTVSDEGEVATSRLFGVRATFADLHD